MPWRDHPGRGSSDEGVSDVLGNILLVGITVAMAASLGFILLSFDGPADVPQTSLDVTVSPGDSQWGTGDESIVVRNNGGDPLDQDEITVLYSINNGPPVSVEGSALAFPAGLLAIGQAWTSSALTLAATDTVQVNVVHRGDASSALASVNVIPAQVSAGASCPFDTAAPTGTWDQSPADLAATTATAVTVTLTLADGCAGVDAAQVPHLFWGISPASPSDQGAMTSLGGNQFEGTIPVPVGGWGPQALKTLSYYASPLVDLRGNSAASTTRNDVIDLTGATQTYVTSTSVVPPTPALGDPGNLGAEDGGFATLTESAVAPSCTAGTQTLYANTVLAAGSWSNTAGALGSTNNDDRATRAAENDQLRLGLADPVVTACTITAVRLVIEQSITDFDNDVWRVDVCLSGTCLNIAPNQAGSASDALRTFTATARPGGGSWVAGDLVNLEIRIAGVEVSNPGPDRDGTWRIDRAWAEVDSTGGSSTYTGTGQFDWTGLPAGTQYLDLGYIGAADEAFNVNVWNWQTSSYTTRGTLSATTITQFVYLLTADEVQSGNVRVRIADANPSDATASTLQLDYARVLTA